MVWINDHSYTHAACQCSWGGVKDSGLGRSHSKFGFYECVDVKLVAWEPGLTRDFWWQPYDRTLGEARAGLGAGCSTAATASGCKALREGGMPLLRAAPAPCARTADQPDVLTESAGDQSLFLLVFGAAPTATSIL